jgi:hypothetical protein
MTRAPAWATQCTAGKEPYLLFEQVLHDPLIYFRDGGAPAQIA